LISKAIASSDLIPKHHYQPPTADLSPLRRWPAQGQLQHGTRAI
jgi:hypothetical protein